MPPGRCPTAPDAASQGAGGERSESGLLAEAEERLLQQREAAAQEAAEAAAALSALQARLNVRFLGARVLGWGVAARLSVCFRALRVLG